MALSDGALLQTRSFSLPGGGRPQMSFKPWRKDDMVKRHRPEEIITKLRQVDVLVSQGSDVADTIRSIGVTEGTYYRWRQEYGGLKPDQVNRLKNLETENSSRLRKGSR